MTYTPPRCPKCDHVLRAKECRRCAQKLIIQFVGKRAPFAIVVIVLVCLLVAVTVLTR